MKYVDSSMQDFILTTMIEIYNNTTKMRIQLNNHNKNTTDMIINV